jgi:hypothetical protein
MNLLTQSQKAKLISNWRKNMLENQEIDHAPVVKLFTPDANATWLLTELDPNNEDTLFGLCDLGQGMPELGYASLKVLRALRGMWGLPVERDTQFKAQHPLSWYVDRAHADRRIAA